MMTSSAIGFLQAKHNDTVWKLLPGLSTLYIAIEWFLSAAAASPTSVTTKNSLMKECE